MPETSIKITDSGKTALDQLSEERGIRKIQIVGRAIEWVANQDKTLQSIILGQADPVDSPALLDVIRCRIEADPADHGDAESEASYFLRLVDRRADVLKTMTKPEQLAVKKLITLLEAEVADISPAARIVDETAAAVKVQKQRPGRRVRSTRA